MNSGNRNNFEDDFDTNRFSNSNNGSGGRGTRNRGNSRNYNESTPYSDSNTAYSNSNNNNNNLQHRRGDSGSEVTSPTYRSNTYSSNSPTSRQKTFNDSEDFAYSTSTLNNLYQPEHAPNTGASPLSQSKRVDPNDYYELSAYNNRGPTRENTNEDDYNPNVYDSERIYLPPHVTVSATAGTAQEIPYYPQRESHLYDEYLNANNQNSFNNTNSYNSHYEEDLMHPNSRTYLDPNAANYARPMNPYVTPAAPIYDPQTLVSQVPSNNKKRNWWKYPYFTFLITLVQVGVFAYQLYSNYYYTSNPIATHPINFMIGPSRSNLIHQGARFVPCMRQGFTDSPVECLQNNNGLGQPLCPLPEVCGFENFSNGQPNQWFRFITPIFLHAGVLHILFNLFSQLTLGGHLEKYWGPFRIFFIYFASGIGGFLFGGVYAMPDLPSVGASGAIFGLVGCELVDLIQNWKYIGSPGCQLFKLVITIAINFALGLLPFIDNFSHIGGFIVGVLCSILIIPLPSRMPKKVILIKWTFMAVAFGILVYLFYFGSTAFYDDKMRESCTWCKYLNCLPVFPICKNPTSPGNGL